MKIKNALKSTKNSAKNALKSLCQKLFRSYASKAKNSDDWRPAWEERCRLADKEYASSLEELEADFPREESASDGAHQRFCEFRISVAKFSRYVAKMTPVDRLEFSKYMRSGQFQRDLSTNKSYQESMKMMEDFNQAANSDVGEKKQKR